MSKSHLLTGWLFENLDTLATLLTSYSKALSLNQSSLPNSQILFLGQRTISLCLDIYRVADITEGALLMIGRSSFRSDRMIYMPRLALSVLLAFYSFLMQNLQLPKIRDHDI
jgi:hypothetical protein